MDSEDMEVESSSDVGHSGMEEPSESGMGMESSEAMSADSSDAAAAPESDCHVGQSSEGLVVFIPETSSSTDVRRVHLPDSSSVAQSTSVSSVSTVTQSVLVSESVQVLVHSSAVSEGGMVVSDSTASTSSDLGSAIDKIIESTIGPDIMNGCIAVTSAENGSAETTQYLILHGPDDGAPMVAQMSSSSLSSRLAIESLVDGPTSTSLEQGDLPETPQGSMEPDQPGHSGYGEHEDGSSSSSSCPDQPQHSQYADSDQTREARYVECSGAEPDQTPRCSGDTDYNTADSEDHLRGYAAECSGTNDDPQRSSFCSSRYVVECSDGYLEYGETDGTQHSRYINSSLDDREHVSASEQEGGVAEEPQHSYIHHNSIYVDEHSLADTVGSQLPDNMDCSDSLAGPFISSSGTYCAQPEPDPEPGPEPEPEVVEFGHRTPNLAELEEMMEVVIVQQFKCKLCPYKSVSKDTLISHMRDKHFKPAGVPGQKKRGRGRPRKSESMARAVSEVKKEDLPEEEDDDIVDAGALDDQGDSDYKPADDETRSRLTPSHCTPPSCSSSSTSTSRKRPRRMVGPPRKFLSGSAESSEAPGSKANNTEEPPAPEEASSSGLVNGACSFSNGMAAEPGISQSDSENRDPSSNTSPDDLDNLPKKRGRPSKRFLQKKYRKYTSRNKYYRSLKPLLRPHNCWICGSRFLSQEDLKFHLDSHEGNDPERFKCLQCSYRCKRWSSLKEHMFNHQGTKPYKCEMCDYSSVYNKDVIRHSAVHNKCKSRKTDVVSKGSEFPCPICTRVYPMQKRLTQHMKTHSTEKPHMCDKCGKSFKKRYTFKMHLLTHIQNSGNNMFKCEFCDYTCNDKKHLLNHQLSHTNDKPFKCEECKYSTSKEDFLLSHIAIKHTGAKPFSCEMCHFMTRHRKNLRLHVQCRHAEAFEQWSLSHPEEPVRRRQTPAFTLKQIEELRLQQESQGFQGTIWTPSLSKPWSPLGTRLYPKMHLETLPSYMSKVAVLKTDSKTLEAGTWAEAAAESEGSSLQPQKIVTFHVSENGETLVQEAFETATGTVEQEQTTADSQEVAEMAIATYEGAEFSVIEPTPVEMTHSLEEVSAEPQVMEVSTEALSITTPYKDSKEKFYLSSGLTDGVLQQVELSSEAPASPYSPPSRQLSAKRFSCRICMEAFHGRSDMENHKRAHLDPKTFKCPDCDFTAPSWPEVKAHMGMHAYLRPHKCNSCSFASKNKKDLRRHMMTHTNEKPYSCQVCGQRFNRNGHLKFHMERLHTQEPSPRKPRSIPSQQTIIVNSDEEALATLHNLQAGQAIISPERLQQALGSEHIIVAQDQSLSDQEEATFIQQITSVDGQTVQYIISQDGVQHLIPREYVVLSDGNHIQMEDGQIAHIQYEHDGTFLQEQQIALSQDGQIQYVPISTEQHVVTPEDLEAAAHSAVTDAAMAQTQTVYTEATPEQLEQLQQQGIQYDVITFTEERGNPEKQEGVVYSIVNFQRHQDSSELYVNWQMHNSKDLRCSVTKEQAVEYSTVMHAS
ncbi:hypothetical protein DNTS_015645 [Danionella cerebrum]|uniref:C2H2-type domain-containing protein n=1 Tax=Danionella cerebrum TaxID=2873325 RepID=A0A553Q6D5_9TELE|nr:hypothetical protein DNTS_015645 [Danionella translucida]